MTTIFHNVSIGLNAATPEEAYTKLCDLLGAAGEEIDWTTDSYSTDLDDTERDTSDLFPDSE